MTTTDDQKPKDTTEADSTAGVSCAAASGAVAKTLPCPFCGGADIRFTNHGKVSRAMGHQNDDVWSTCCYKCGATFPNRYRRKLLVEQWNRRPLNDQAQATPT